MRWLAASVVLLVGTAHGLAVAADEAPAAFLGGETSVEFGALKPGFHVGYGTEELWLGADARGGLELDHLGAFVGPRLHAGPFDLRSGLFGAYAVRRSFLPVLETYTRDDAERLLDGEHARYLGVSTVFAWQFEVLSGSLVGESEVAGVFSVPERRRVFVEHLNAIDGDSWILRQRFGYLTALAVLPALGVGAAVEGLWLNAREESVLRAGPQARLDVHETLALRLELLPVLHSPDRLGLAGGRFEFGLWYRFLP